MVMTCTNLVEVSFLGAGVFCCYLVFDTWRIAHELEVDDFIEGAIQLYMDIASLQQVHVMSCCCHSYEN